MVDPDPITRLNAALEGRYRIESELGEGGMATVYLADDLKHERKVALKVLKPELAAVVGAERFLAEIKTTANLQHPHILPLFDSGEADSFLFYVMPYVEGESLRDRLAREKQLPVDEAVRIATDVAEALHSAHVQGVIHRDVKPANILLSKGRPLVADFGIALAVSAAGGGRLTETGLSMGTPYYMSPEQASADREPTPASDVYSLGCVLYEMLVGDPPYTASSSQAVLAKILTEDPRAPTALRSSIPPNVDAAIRRSLEKLPADRFTTTQDLASALRARGFSHGPAEASGFASGPRERLMWITALVTTAGVAALGWLQPLPDLPVVRHALTIPLAAAPAGSLDQRFAIAPDGRRLAYIGPGDGNESGVWHRELNSLGTALIPGSNGARGVSFSPDGSRVVFVTSQLEMFVTSVGSGEAPVKIADLEVQGGITWGAGEPESIFTEGLQGLVRVRASGGTLPEPISRVSPNETRHIFPHTLPNGRGVLFIVRRGGDSSGNQIAVVDLGTGEHEVLLAGVRVVYAETGHLVYVSADGALAAVAFDQEAMRLSGEPFVLAGGVRVGQFGGAEIALSETGQLLYVTEGDTERPSQLVWVERDGTAETLEAGWTEAFRTLALAPGGTRLAVSIASRGEEHVWVKGLGGGSAQQLSTSGQLNWRPVWRPDGDAVGYVSDRLGALRAYVRQVDSSADDQELVPSMEGVEEILWSPDGTTIVLRRGGGLSGGTRDILAVPVGGTEPDLLLATDANERVPDLSPDGLWMVYMSDESVMVRPFRAGEAEWVVATDGAHEPLWSPTGDEIFYRDENERMVAVAVETDPTFSVVGTQELFDASPYRVESNHRAFDVTEDGQRFVMIRESEQVGQLVWVQSFHEELKARVPN